MEKQFIKNSNLCVVNHPILQHNMSVIRNKNTSSENFRYALARIFDIVFCEATKGLSLEDVEIETPVANAKCKVLSSENTIIISPILRAGLALADEAVKILPQAIISHLGMYRDEKTLNPIWYYNKSYNIKFNPNKSTIFLLDPMLATGNSIIQAIKNYVDLGVPCENINVVAIVSSQIGINNIDKLYPNVKIFAAALDEELNANGYIVPGLGDAGDRIFNTTD